MVAHVRHLATIHCKPRQVRKEAAVVVDSCAGERRAWVASLFLGAETVVSELVVDLR